MSKPSLAAGLLAPARVTRATPAGAGGAVTGAINLAAVATTTDQHLSMAFRTHEQPGGRRDAAAGSADIPWTNATIWNCSLFSGSKMRATNAFNSAFSASVSNERM
jgi:hypothetical protein